MVIIHLVDVPLPHISDIIHMHMFLDKGKVMICIQQQAARLSAVGPPSFPPPPPPEDAPSPTALDHMYEMTPALIKKEASQDPCEGHGKEATRPAATVTNDGLEDDFVPGYDVVSKPKKKKKSSTNASSTQTSPLANEQSPTSPLNLVKDNRVKSTIIERAPHLYEAVSDSFGAPEEPGRNRPKNIVVPMRHTHIYESADDIQPKVRPKSRLPSRKRPPPPPPTATTPDTSAPSIAAEQTNLPSVRPKVTPTNKMSSPVAELVSSPMSYLGADLAGKKLTVDIQSDQGEDNVEGKEPRFLFNKGHSSSFIRVSSV